MATADEKPHGSAPPTAKPVAGDTQDSNAEAANESFKRSISAGLEPMREEQVQNAVKFLSHPKVRGSPVIYRRSFLEKKGLTREEIDEAFRLVPDPPSNATNAEAANPNQAIQPKPSTSLQPQVPTQIPQSAAVPTKVVSMVPSLQQSKFQLSYVFLAIGVFAASGAGTAVLFKNSILPRLKSWIRKVAKEEDDAEMKEKSKLSLAEEAAEAAKAAASAAVIVAKASQDLLNAKSEEKKYFEAFIGLLDVQVKEMKSMGDAIRKLKDKREVTLTQDKQIEEYILHSASGNGTTNNTRRISLVDQSDLRLQVSKQGKVNGTPNMDFGEARPSSAPVSVDPTAKPYPNSFAEIMSMVQRRETSPGIKELNNMPPNPNQQPGNPHLEPRIKPWEVTQQVHQSSSIYGLQSQVRVDGSSSEFQANGHSSQLNGESIDNSDPWWKRKTVKITEIEPETEEPKVVPSYGIGSHNWRGRDWVPPQTPSVAIPEAAAAIRQPKPSVQKQQVVNEQSSMPPANGEDGITRVSDSTVQAESSTGGSTDLNPSETQEDRVDGLEVN